MSLPPQCPHPSTEPHYLWGGRQHRSRADGSHLDIVMGRASARPCVGVFAALPCVSLMLGAQTVLPSACWRQT